MSGVSNSVAHGALGQQQRHTGKQCQADALYQCEFSNIQGQAVAHGEFAAAIMERKEQNHWPDQPKQVTEEGEHAPQIVAEPHDFFNARMTLYVHRDTPRRWTGEWS